MDINYIFTKRVFKINKLLHLIVLTISTLYVLPRPFELVTRNYFEKYPLSPVSTKFFFRWIFIIIIYSLLQVCRPSHWPAARSAFFFFRWWRFIFIFFPFISRCFPALLFLFILDCFITLWRARSLFCVICMLQQCMLLGIYII